MSDIDKNKAQLIEELSTVRQRMAEMEAADGEHKRAKEKLWESEERYRLLIENLPSVSWTTDEHGHTTFISPNVKEVFGYTPKEIYAEGADAWFEKIHPEDRERIAQSFSLLFTAQQKFDEEYRIQRKDGEWIWLHDRAYSTYEKGGTRYAVGIFSDITVRKQAEEALRKSEERYRCLLQNLDDIAYTVDCEGMILFVGPQARRYGYEPDELIGKHFGELIYTQDRMQVLHSLEETLKKGDDGTSLEFRVVTRDGGVRWVEERGNPMRDETGGIVGISGILRDITEGKELKEQLCQSQKMEAIGQLAGGIAHDFNNMLMVIITSCDFLLLNLDLDEQTHADIELIKEAGERAAALTQQILAFSRRQILRPEILNLNEVLSDTYKMMQRLIGENIELSTVFKAGKSEIEADRGQLEQILMNLVVNARDAMPQGGKLTIETDHVDLDEEYVRMHPQVQPGSYVMLSISDTGVGMNEETRHRIFEPFFTTKKDGAGTGMGLSTVYGIVKQSGGNIWVYSEIDMGTTVKIYLPKVSKKNPAREEEWSTRVIPRGDETILAVEDEELVRQQIYRILSGAGYTVLTAGSGEEALQVGQQHGDQIDMLLTDVVMPGMNGRQLADHFLTGDPEIKVLYMSGYTDNVIASHGVLEGGIALIPKPFSADVLATAVRQKLDR